MNLDSVLIDGDAAEGRRIWLADLGDQHEVEVGGVEVEAAIVHVQVEVDHQGIVGSSEDNTDVGLKYTASECIDYFRVGIESYCGAKREICSELESKAIKHRCGPRESKIR